VPTVQEAPTEVQQYPPLQVALGPQQSDELVQVAPEPRQQRPPEQVPPLQHWLLAVQVSLGPRQQVPLSQPPLQHSAAPPQLVPAVLQHLPPVQVAPVQQSEG
jgi:hypothetical protein